MKEVQVLLFGCKEYSRDRSNPELMQGHYTWFKHLYLYEAVFKGKCKFYKRKGL